MRSLALASLLVAGSAQAAVPEAQPTDPAFPQHRSYLYGSEAEPYRMTYVIGKWFLATDDYVLYEPVAGSATPSSAPLVVLFQGFVIDGPWQFDRLVRHLTRSGMSVVYPTYLDMRQNLWSFSDWVERSSASIRGALALLDDGEHLPVARDAAGQAELAFVGHSIGSYVASFVAERAATRGDLPAPRAMVFLDPAGFDFKSVLGIDTAELGDIDPATEVIFLSAEDALVDEEGALDPNTQYAVKDLAGNLPIACGRLSAWVVRSDAEGDSELVSDHYDGPQTHWVCDAVDWWGYWPQLSAHLKYAFWGSYAGFRHAGGLYAGRWLTEDGEIIRPIAPRMAHPLVPGGYVCSPALP